MRYQLKLAIALFVALGLSCGGAKKPMPTKITFETDFAAAKKLARESEKPMIIDFYTDWCKWCDSLDANTYTDSIVIGMSVDDIFVKINAEVDTTLAREFGISGYPTIVIAGPDGVEIDRMWGYFPPTDFYNQVQLYLQGKETLDDYLTRLKDEPENLEYLSMVGEKYASRGKFDMAIEYYRKIQNLDPDNSKNYGLTAMQSIYDTQGRAKNYDGAIETCKEIIQKFPTAKEADDAAAMIAYYTAKKGDNEQAVKIYREYLQNYPSGNNADWVRKRVADLEDKS